jgi:TRAP transporter TAXI family solute receptor
MREIKHSFKKHIGARKDQQDSVNITQNGKDILIALGDGMGGHTGGAMASNLFITKAQNLFENNNYENTQDFFQKIVFESENDIANFAKQSGEDPHTTATLALINDKKVTFANIGDSRVYIFDRNGLILRSRDHSVPEMLLQIGDISEDEMATHPDQNKLTKSLGPDSHEKLSHYSFEFQEDQDYIVLVCSDGFWEYVKEKEMAHFLFNSNIETALSNMIEIARKRGRDKGDNISVGVAILTASKPKKEEVIIEQVSPEKKVTKGKEKSSRLNIKLISLLALLTIAMGIIGTYFYLKPFDTPTPISDINNSKSIKEDLNQSKITKEKNIKNENIVTDNNVTINKVDENITVEKINKKIITKPIILNEAKMSCKKPISYKIATGSKDGTYYKIGQDLAKYVAPKSCINLEVLTSKGSLANTKHLIDTDNVKFAIVQNDVLQNIKEKADNNDKDSKKLLKSLRVLKPLYNEEIHLLTLKSSPLNTFGDIKDKRIGIDVNDSGTSLTSNILYKELFGTKLPYPNQQNFENSLKDLRNNDIDIIISVGGQPLKKLIEEDKLKLLSYIETEDNLNPDISYYATEINSKNYTWLDESIPTLSTKAYLITYNFQSKKESSNIKQFLNNLNITLDKLKSSASLNKETPHPKWKQVTKECMPKLPGGWKYYSVVSEICKNQK